MKTNGDAPSPRTNHTCVGYGDSLIIFGGYDKDDQLCNDMYQYNISMNILYCLYYTIYL